MPSRVVVIGAGFGGLSCARALAGRDVDVLLIDRNNYHLFTPLLYQVASSLLDPIDIAQPVRKIFRRVPNVRFLLADVAGVDFERKVLRTREGADLPYEFLVIAAGSRTSFFGLKELEARAHGLKDLPEALELRNHILRCFEAAVRETDPDARRELLTFAVVGGGPTGVEYAGALSELIRRVLAGEYRELDFSQVRVALVEGLPRLLPPFDERLSREAEAELRRHGVELLLGRNVAGADERGLRFADGAELRARTIVWAAGVQAAELAETLEAARGRQGRLLVDERLRLAGKPGAFAVGDIAAAEQDGRTLAMMAPQAMQEGRYAARAILAELEGRTLEPFRYVDRGSMATIGRNAAVAQVGPVRLKGLVGWLAWLALHLYFLIGFRNRLAVLARWAWTYVLYDRPVRIIVRARGTPGPPGASADG